MLRHAATALIVSLGLLSACSSDETGTSGAAGTTPVASNSPAPAPTAADGGDGGTVDCEAAKDAFGRSTVNIQILAQLPQQTDVSQWITDIGTMPEFGAQLDVLGGYVVGDADASAAVEFYRGANDIAQRGYAGDAAAPAELAAYLGSDLADTLSKKVSIAIALDAAGC